MLNEGGKRRAIDDNASDAMNHPRENVNRLGRKQHRRPLALLANGVEYLDAPIRSAINWLFIAA